MVKDKPCLENYFVEPNEMREEVSSEQNNTFTKDMLVSGKHVVKLGNGEYRLVLGDRLMGYRLVGVSQFTTLCGMSDNLQHNIYSDWDIVKVYEVDEYFVLGDLPHGDCLTLTWSEEAQKRIKKRELEDKVSSLREELKQVEDELEELRMKKLSMFAAGCGFIGSLFCLSQGNVFWFIVSGCVATANLIVGLTDD